MTFDWQSVRAWAEEIDLWLGLAVNGWIVLTGVNFAVQSLLQRTKGLTAAFTLISSLKRAAVQVGLAALGIAVGFGINALIDAIRG